MFLLLVVSFVWAFSFGLIKGRLAGLDPTVVAALRLALALVVFLPFLRPRMLPVMLQLRLAAIGAVQFGIMYVLYLGAFAHLQAHEVALFTITTPIFVTLIDAALDRRFVLSYVFAALLSVAGAAAIVWRGVGTHDALAGVILVQLSNLCFAAGQLAWRRTRATVDASIPDSLMFGLLYAGALITTVVWSFFTSDWAELHLTWPQSVTLVYLGIIASGAGFFWWNIGSTKVNAGTLAAFNNAKIPLAVACSLLFFREHADITRLVVGGMLMAGGVIVAQLSSPRRRS